MGIKLAFLGTGTCESTSRNPQGMALSNGDEVVLIDCGGGSYHQLARLNDDDFNPERICSVFLTHFHPDHVSGLPDLLWGETWKSSGARKDPLTIIGPPGCRDFIAHRLIPFMGDYEAPFEIKAVELPDRHSFPGSFYSAESFSMAHSGSSAGYLFIFKGFKLAVSGDTGFCPGLVDLLSLSDAAVLEWSNDEDSYSGHISGDDIKRLIKEGLLPGVVYAIHLYLPPGMTLKDRVNHYKEYLDALTPPFVFPEDRMVVELVS